MLKTVQASPAAVAAGDRAQWLAIFARYNIVEDPVGSRAHISGTYDRATACRGNGPLSRFYDTFIAPNTIVFHVEQDIVCDQYVLRDLQIEISMDSRVRVVVPMHLLYQLQPQNGELKIFRLAAYWELLPMVGQAMGFGWHSIKAMSALGWRMLRVQGFSGALGFCRALSTVGAAGKERVEAFVRAYNNADKAALEGLFEGRPVAIEWPVPERVTNLSSLLAQGRGTLCVDKLLASGHTISASCQLGSGPEQRRGILLFEFTGQRVLDRVSAYWQQAPQATLSSSGAL
jgi:hypothetical protein